MTVLTDAAAQTAETAAPGPIMARITARNLTGDTDGPDGFTAGVCLTKMIAVLAISVGLGASAAKRTIAQFCRNIT